MEGNRKVVQIAPMVVPGMDNMASPYAEVLALCDDGTIWRGDGHGYWSQIQGPEHLGSLTSAYSTRTKLKETLGPEVYESVRGVLRAGGVYL